MAEQELWWPLRELDAEDYLSETVREHAGAMNGITATSAIDAIVTSFCTA